MASKPIIDVNGEKYMNTKLAAEYWDLKASYVSQLCREDKVPRAIKIDSRLWYMPLESIKPMTDSQVRNVLFLTMELRNELTYRIDYEELDLKQEQLPIIYKYLAEVGYIKNIVKDIKSEDLPYQVVLTSKGMNLIRNREKILDNPDIMKTLLEWANIIKLLFELTKNFH